MLSSITNTLCRFLERAAGSCWLSWLGGQGGTMACQVQGWTKVLSWTLSPVRSSVPRTHPFPEPAPVPCHGAAERLQPPGLVRAGAGPGAAALGQEETRLGPAQVPHRPDGQDGHCHRSQQRAQAGTSPAPAPCPAGIGKCVALDLARRNARTILACRSRERGQAAVEEIRAATGNPAVLLRLLDTSSLASVRAFAQAVLREEKRLDVLVNNAGLTDLLKASAPARIVNVSSFRHGVGTADVRYLTGQAQPGGYDPIYNSTKLMNVLFTAELAQRLEGTGVTANSVNPGVVSTRIMRHFSWAMRTLFLLLRPFIKSAEQGAVSTIYCAVSEEVSGITGKYFGSDCGLALPSAAARDAGLARKLWEESERLTGLPAGPQH
nr:retinol dehydrogenase 12 isoform X2 [Anser cygnoides]